MASNFGQIHTNKTIPVGAVPIEKASRAQGLSIVIPAFVFLALAWLAVLLRFWTRVIVVRAVGWDDWTMGLSAVRRIAERSTGWHSG